MASGKPDLKKAENTKFALDKFGKYLVTESRKNLSRKRPPHGNSINNTKTLYNSLAYESKVNPRSIEFDFLMAEYGEWVDKGRKKGKMPPFGSIYAWVARRKIQFKDSKTKKFLSYSQTASMVMLKIKNKGIDPTNFYTRPFQLGYAKLPEEVRQAYELDVMQFLEFTINELNKKYK